MPGTVQIKPAAAAIARLGRGASIALSAGCLLCAQGPVALAGTAPLPGFSLEVSPTRLVVPAGTRSTTQRFQVTNGGRKSFTVTVEKANFTAGEDGALHFQPDAPYAAAAWAGVSPTHFRMAAGTTRKVTIRLTLPASPEPGDHQLAVIFKVPAGRNAANIRINRGIAAPVFITVPGRTDDSAEVMDLRAPGFALRGPVFLTTRIRDYGTVHRDFRGDGRLRARINGSKVVFPDFTVLRGSTRTATARWNPPLMCVCHATVSIRSRHGDPSSATVRIIVFPLHLAAILLAVLVTALLIAWLVRRRFRARVLAAATALHESEDGFDV